MNKGRPDFTSDLFPWKFDLEDELAEIFANHRENQHLLLGLRGLYTVFFALVTCGLFALFAYEGAHTVTDWWVLVIVGVWMVWKLVNEIRFFHGYHSHVKMCECAKHTLYTIWLNEGRK